MTISILIMLAVSQLLKTLESAIPDPINKVVSVQDRYEMYIEQIAKRMMKKGKI